MRTLLLLGQLWASLLGPHDLANGVKLYGSWQSCRGDDGQYGELAYDRVEAGKHLWSLHLGPRDEFALYAGFGPEGPDHVHTGAKNLLAPAFHVSDVNTWGHKRTWSIPSLRLLVNAVEAGGSRLDCDSFVVKVETLKP